MTSAMAALLGAVQGVTEFLPISSKTHLVVVPALLGDLPPTLAFITLLHLGTLVGLLAYFARDLWGFARDLPRPRSEGRRMVRLLALATIPAAVLGFIFEETFERLLAHPRQAAFALLITAALLVSAEWAAGTMKWAGRLPRALRPAVTTTDAVAIGLAQAAALLPGISRSGVTMAMGLFIGLRREVAARFSFLLAIPVLVGSNMVEIPKLAEQGLGAPEVLGFGVAVVTGYASVALLLRFLRRYSFLPFAAYTVVFGVGAGLALT